MRQEDAGAGVTAGGTGRFVEDQPPVFLCTILRSGLKTVMTPVPVTGVPSMAGVPVTDLLFSYWILFSCEIEGKMMIYPLKGRLFRPE